MTQITFPRMYEQPRGPLYSDPDGLRFIGTTVIVVTPGSGPVLPAGYSAFFVRADGTYLTRADGTYLARAA